MIVVDTNVIGYLFLSSNQSPAAEQALQKDGEWAAPILWRSEFRNVLALYVRKHLINLRQAQRIMTDALALMQGREFEPSFHEVLRLAAKSNCSAYDCEFVAVAGDLSVPLITVDKQLLREFPAAAMSLNSYVKTFPENA
jgi:predicted nucleic acid-binding protein